MGFSMEGIPQGGNWEAKCTFAEVGFWERNMKSASSGGVSGVVVVDGVGREELLKVGGWMPWTALKTRCTRCSVHRRVRVDRLSSSLASVAE